MIWKNLNMYQANTDFQLMTIKKRLANRKWIFMFYRKHIHKNQIRFTILNFKETLEGKNETKKTKWLLDSRKYLKGMQNLGEKRKKSTHSTKVKENRFVKSFKSNRSTWRNA